MQDLNTLRRGALILVAAAGLSACTTATGQPSAVPAAAGTGTVVVIKYCERAAGVSSD